MSNDENESSAVIPWRHEDPIGVPASMQERRIAIRYLDWDRCKRNLQKVRKEAPRLDIVFSFLFGIAAMSLFSLITFYENPQTQYPQWTYPVYYLLFAFSLAIAFVFVYTDQKLRQKKESDIDEIIEDMESIEKTFPETM